MKASRKIMLIGGLVLVLLGMSYGLCYAVLVEHQTLDTMGAALTGSFASASGRRMDGTRVDLESYRLAAFDYTRQVDAHSHWIGLGILMIGIGVIFNRVSLAERPRFIIALALFIGSTVFPLGVLLQTVNHGPVPRVVAAAGAALVTAALAAVAIGFLRADE